MTSPAPQQPIPPNAPTPVPPSPVPPAPHADPPTLTTLVKDMATHHLGAVSLAAIVAAAGVVFAAGKVADRLETAEARINQRMEQGFARADQRLGDVETRLTKRMDDRFELLERRVSRLEERVWSGSPEASDGGWDGGDAWAVGATVDAPPPIDDTVAGLRRSYPGIAVTRTTNDDGAWGMRATWNGATYLGRLVGSRLEWSPPLPPPPSRR